MKFFETVQNALRTQHYAYRTEKTYMHWIRQYVRYLKPVHPREAGTDGVKRFLTHLAVDRSVGRHAQENNMDVIIKLDKEWWLLPAEKKFTQKELVPFLDCKYIGIMQMGVSYHFFDMQPKAKVLQVLRAIREAAQHSMKPTYSMGGNIAFKRVRQSKVAVPA